MLTELALYGGSYVTGGLLTARQMKFHIEDTLEGFAGKTAHDRYREWVRRHSGAGHRLSSSKTFCITCHHDDYAPDKAEAPPYGGNVKRHMLWAGVGWPVVVPAVIAAKTAGLVTRIAVKTVSPATHWFFENPKHRKARRNRTTV